MFINRSILQRQTKQTTHIFILRCWFLTRPEDQLMLDEKLYFVECPILRQYWSFYLIEWKPHVLVFSCSSLGLYCKDGRNKQHIYLSYGADFRPGQKINWCWMKNFISLSVLFFVNINIFLSFCGEVNSSLSFVVVDLGARGGSDLKTEKVQFFIQPRFLVCPLTNDTDWPVCTWWRCRLSMSIRILSRSYES